MSVYEVAKQLGLAIKDDEVLKEYDRAKLAYESHEELQEKLRLYNVQRALLTEEFGKELEEQSAETIEKVKASMDAIGKEIVAYEEYKVFLAAQKAVEELMKKINSIISQHAFGVDPNACTHDCSTCSGCH